jgi:hypothetical protein
MWITMLQTDSKNADDHLFFSAAQNLVFGIAVQEMA